MKNLQPSLKDELALLEKYRLTPTELMFIRTLLIYQNDGNEEYFGAFCAILHSCDVSIMKVVVSLQKKGVILKSYKIKEGSFNPMDIPVNKNFTKQLYRCSYEMGKELYDNYPQFTTINGASVAIRAVAKKFDSLEDAYFRYGKEIRWDPELHNHIIELVKWGKSNNVITCSLASFIINHSWNDLEAMRDGDELNINFNSLREL